MKCLCLLKGKLDLGWENIHLIGVQNPCWSMIVGVSILSNIVWFPEMGVPPKLS